MNDYKEWNDPHNDIPDSEAQRIADLLKQLA